MTTQLPWFLWCNNSSTS